MTDLEDALRGTLHARLDTVDAPAGLGADLPARAGAVRRRRLAIGAGAAALGLVVTGGAVLAVDAWRADRSVLRSIAQPPEESGPAARARRVAEQFAAGDFSSVRDDMTDSARRALTLTTLRGVWRSVFPTGSPVTFGNATESVTGARHVGAVELRSGATQGKLRVVVDDDGRITGLLLTSAGPGYKSAEIARAGNVAHLLASGDYAAVRRDFDATMTSGLSEQRLRQGWDQMVAQYGDFRRTDGAVSRLAGSNVVVDVVCEFAEGTMKVRVTYDSQDRIAGLYILVLDA